MTGIILLIFFIYLLFALKYKFMPYGRIGKNLNNRQGINSLMVLLGSSMGVGNIVGVGVAIYLAGPGVIFWMLVSALISSTTNYLEVYFSKKQIIKSAVSEHVRRRSCLQQNPFGVRRSYINHRCDLCRWPILLRRCLDECCNQRTGR